MSIFLPSTYEFVVAESEADTRLDRYLASRELPQSRSQIKRLIDAGNCQVNERIARPSRKLRPGDSVAITVPPPAPDRALPEKIALTVLFEDPHLIVVDKPAGMVVHPAPGHQSGTLVNALLGHCESLSGVGGTLRPGIVHRLDRLTSGVLVASKTDDAHRGLSAQFAIHAADRRYIAVVAGALKPPRGTFDTFHGRHPGDRKKFTSRCSGGRRAVTHYEALESLIGATVVEARLETGRTHQVRVHFSDAGHPLLGDPMYGRSPARGRARAAAGKLGRQALHAQVLGFEHPVTCERLRFATPMPPDMQDLVAALSPGGVAGDATSGGLS